ncbi:hypothetical protein HUU42_14265 [bacterium]|nr:hypothetical protein [bacterium]
MNDIEIRRQILLYLKSNGYDKYGLNHMISFDDLSLSLRIDNLELRRNLSYLSEADYIRISATDTGEYSGGNLTVEGLNLMEDESEFNIKFPVKIEKSVLNINSKIVQSNFEVNGNSSENIEIAKLSLLQVFKQLTISSWMLIVTLVSTLVTVSYQFGSASIGNKAIDATEFSQILEYSYQYQVSLKSRPSVKIFEEFLNDASAGNWNETWDLMGPSWKNELANEKSSLKKAFRMTKRMSASYYIPIEIVSDREKYLVDFYYTDYMPVLRSKSEILQSPLSTTLSETKIRDITDEILSILPQHFATQHYNNNQLKNNLFNYLTSKVTLELMSNVV